MRIQNLKLALNVYKALSMTVLFPNVLSAQIIVKAAFLIHNVKHAKMDIISMMRKSARYVGLLAVIV